MYSAEPLPHFVDEYLAYLYEVHPTTATFDGVHTHDDLLEDLGRQAIDGQIRDLGGLARRLAAIDPARLTDSERLSARPSRPASADGCSSSRRSARGSGTRSTTRAFSARASPARRSSTTRRCRNARAASSRNCVRSANSFRRRPTTSRIRPASSSRSASRACEARAASSTTICRARSAT